jgi:hypothetical protein
MYTVRGTIEFSHYMGEREKEKVIHAVAASNADEAETKFRAYYEAKTREHDVYVSVLSCDVFEPIL